MRTKLVYVLTCAPEATYIEQAMMSVYSARHHNPDARIVLMVDDKTDALLAGIRGEILNYIGEKIVVPFEDENQTPMYRSRWIKTKVRELIKGDFLFIDSDTIIQKSLADIDDFDCEVGGVLESHLPVSRYGTYLYKSANTENSKLGVDIDKEEYYFSSGVLLVKETKDAHQLYELWHQYWKEGNEIGVKIDQPALAKANREIGHIIRQMPDTYNCILFTRPPFMREAHILHIASLLNPSYFFSNRVCEYIAKNGINEEWLSYYILHICETMFPFDYDLRHASVSMKNKWIRELGRFMKDYGKYIDGTYSDIEINSRFRSLILFLLRHNFQKCAVAVWMVWRDIYIRCKKIQISPNIMQKN